MLNRLKSAGERASKVVADLVRAGVDSKAVRAISGGIALFAMSHVAEIKKAEAQETPSGTLSTEFDDGVNGILSASEVRSNFALAANLIPDPVAEDEFWMTWQAPDQEDFLGGSADIYWAKFKIADDGAGGFTATRITPVEPYPGFSAPSLSEIQLLLRDRGDGVFDKISNGSIADGSGMIEINGVMRCADDNPGVSFPTYLGLSHDSSKLRVAIDIDIPSYSRNVNIYKGSLYAPDICDDIEAQIALGDIYETGTVDPWESDYALDDICGPEDPVEGNWVAVTRMNGSDTSSKETHLFHRDPDGTLKYQERDVDGIYADEDIDWLAGGTPNPDFGGNDAYSLLMRETEDGSKPVIFAYAIPNPAPGPGRAGVLAAHIINDLTRAQAPVTMLVDETALELENRDSDGDGVPDSEDGAWLRADPEQTDVSGPAGTTAPDGVNDIVGIQCEGTGLGGFPVHPAGETSASGRLRVCTSQNGYAYAYTFDAAEQDVGSNLESNMPIDDANFNSSGNIVLQPGQTIRYEHSADPRFAVGPSRQIIFGDGYDINIKFNSTTHLDGTPGESVLSYNTNGDPFGTAPRIETFSGPRVWSSGGPAYGAALGLGGTDVEVTQGETHTPRDCESLPGGCVLPGGEDGGTAPDGGVDGTDAGTPPADSGSDSGGDTPDEGTPPPDAGATPDMEADAETPADGTDSDAPAQMQTPDGGMPDAAEAVADAMPSDSTRQPSQENPVANSDSGPVRTDIGMRQPADPKGCACDVSGNHENNSPFEPPAWLLIAGAARFGIRRRVRSGVKETVVAEIPPEL